MQYASPKMDVSSYMPTSYTHINLKFCLLTRNLANHEKWLEVDKSVMADLVKRELGFTRRHRHVCERCCKQTTDDY